MPKKRRISQQVNQYIMSSNQQNHVISLEGSEMTVSISQRDEKHFDVSSFDPKFKSIMNGSAVVVLNAQGNPNPEIYPSPTEEQKVLFDLLKRQINK